VAVVGPSTTSETLELGLGVTADLVVVGTVDDKKKMDQMHLHSLDPVVVVLEMMLNHAEVLAVGAVALW
jgi:hypothetical protein